MTRVVQMAGLAGMSVRTLQRNFAEYVGAGPKWVVQRCRLQDAAARAANDESVNWAELAAELGFADQAHLTRAFTATIGTSAGGLRPTGPAGLMSACRGCASNRCSVTYPPSRKVVVHRFSGPRTIVGGRP